jgi:superfamily II DNA or RNA helicase/HKD family nuclease
MEDGMRDVAAGIYEDLVTEGLATALTSTPTELVQYQSLDPADSHVVLTRHLARLISRSLQSVPGTEQKKLAAQVQLANRIATAVGELSEPDAVLTGDRVADAAQQLLAVATPSLIPAPVAFPARPEVPLSTSALLVNGRGQPRIGYEVERELASADSVDLLCAFITWHGVRVLERALADLQQRGVRLRVITTTYLGATEPRAVERLIAAGADVRISYENRTTRLHAKAWLFHRNSGYSTGYVGSSNLSRAAMIDGLEWNVRLSSVEQAHLLQTFAETFDSYWHDPAFEPYDAGRFTAAIVVERGGRTEAPTEITSLDVRPFGYQQEILEALDAERLVHDRWQNLVVMATGTGKTVISALDYRRLRAQGHVETVLFVAHRKEILTQSRSTFRQVLRRGDFGELLVDGTKPTQWQHVFASVQSLAQLDLAELKPDLFDLVVVDEFHHAEAATYRRLLNHLRPKVLVGLTATPERADGRDVIARFGGRPAVELRLWEALEQRLLAPFQYFGKHDDVPLDTVRWRRGSGYDVAELSNLYTGSDARVRLILQAVVDTVAEPTRMRALSFCVSIEHAIFMSAQFAAAGIASRAVTSRDGAEARAAALTALRNGEVNVLFTVDLFNEGFDLPEIDTVLFLRPTESATVFLQQLGRGLRLAEDKPCLTVLDFIGAQHRSFRFDLRFRALTGTSRRGLEREIDLGFPTLPAGCSIHLDRVAQQVVLDNVRQSLRLPWPQLASELAASREADLPTFLEETGLDVEDLYRGTSRSWLDLQRAAGVVPAEPGPDDARLRGAFARMLHVDDVERLDRLGALLNGAAFGPSERDWRLMAMLHFALWGSRTPFSSVEESLARLLADRARSAELAQLIGVLRERIHRVAPALDSGPRPLHVHARYSREEALAAFGMTDLAGTFGSGVRWVPDERADLFFVTLIKTEGHFSPTTMYADSAVTPTLFQWESQNTTTEASPVGQRYVHHRERGSSVHLFVRETKTADGALGVPPYLYAGPMTYQSHTGNRPMRILWRLHHALPGDVFHAARVA